MYVLLCKHAQNECAIQVWHSAHAISTQHVHTAVVWVEKKQKKTTQNAEPRIRVRIIHGMSKYGDLL